MDQFPPRSLAPWLPASTLPKIRAAVERALKDVGICEMPLGSNRSGRIDEYLRAAGVPESVITSGKGYWCAAAASAWWREAGMMIPPLGYNGGGPASCDTWMTWGKANNRWHDKPVVGAMVLYGVPGDAQHIGMVIRVDPILYGVEGNTTAGGDYNRDGAAVDAKGVTTKRVLGYVWPEGM